MSGWWSRGSSVVLVVCAVLATVIVWDDVRLAQVWSAPGSPRSSIPVLPGSLSDVRLLSTVVVVLLLGGAVALVVRRRRADGLVAVVLAAVVAAAFLVTPLPVVGDTVVTIAVEGGPLTRSFLWAAAMTALVALGALVLAVRTWRTGVRA